jgi:hypothetical protein
VNLHEWITARVEQVEAERRSVVIIPNAGGMPIAGKITEAVRVDNGIELTVTPGEPVTPAVLRRCEADRRILARHKLPLDGATWFDATMCVGCGTEGDRDDPVTDNINDCPELHDLAHAHGITEAGIAGLDWPEPAPRPSGPVIGHASINVTAAMTTDQVPPALRGTRWRGHRHG